MITVKGINDSSDNSSQVQAHLCSADRSSDSKRTGDCNPNQRQSYYALLVSYAEVVKGSRVTSKVADENGKGRPITMSWTRQPDNEERLSRCDVGVLKEFSSVFSVNKRLVDRDYSYSSSYLGDKNILWCFGTTLEKEGFLKNIFF
ncbi:hypothetical protein Q3G72_016627 [Acer saccharum]|nr:hypothetical protein Q3G72_016627 [Acer saccharum]